MTIHWNLPANFYLPSVYLPSNPFGGNYSQAYTPLLSFAAAPVLPLAPIFTPVLPRTSFFTGIKTYAQKTWNNVCQSVSKCASDIISTAKKYLGYNEMDGSCSIWGGSKSRAWCALYATSMAREAGSNIPKYAQVKDILAWGVNNNKFTKQPKVGSLIILRGPKGQKETGISHTGIVKEIKNGKVYVIAGNSGKKDHGKVGYESYNINSRDITGYVVV